MDGEVVGAVKGLQELLDDKTLQGHISHTKEKPKKLFVHQVLTPPSTERYRAALANLYQELHPLMQSMLDKGVIQENSSSLVAPINMIKKKSGAWRLRITALLLCESPHVQQCLPTALY